MDNEDDYNVKCFETDGHGDVEFGLDWGKGFCGDEVDEAEDDWVLEGDAFSEWGNAEYLTWAFGCLLIIIIVSYVYWRALLLCSFDPLVQHVHFYICHCIHLSIRFLFTPISLCYVDHSIRHHTHQQLFQKHKPLKGNIRPELICRIDAV